MPGRPVPVDIQSNCDQLYYVDIGGFILGTFLGRCRHFFSGSPVPSCIMAPWQSSSDYRMKQAEAIMSAVGTIVSVLESTNRDIEYALQKA